MTILTISELEQIFIINTDNPILRVAHCIKGALRIFPQLKDEFFSKDNSQKNQTNGLIAWILKKVDKEFDLAAEKTNMNYNQLLAAIFKSNHLTPIESQMFLQAQSLVMQHSKEIFQTSLTTPKAHKKVKRKKVCIGV